MVDAVSSMMLFPSPYGDFVFQRKESIKQGFDIMNKFPSPYGDFVFQRATFMVSLSSFPQCFRPLTGILFFNTMKKKCESFRPLTGILFFNPRQTGDEGHAAGSRFRPLTGILFFNSPSEKPCHS